MNKLTFQLSTLIEKLRPYLRSTPSEKRYTLAPFFPRNVHWRTSLFATTRGCTRTTRTASNRTASTAGPVFNSNRTPGVAAHAPGAPVRATCLSCWFFSSRGIIVFGWLVLISGWENVFAREGWMGRGVGSAASFAPCEFYVCRKV